MLESGCSFRAAAARVLIRAATRSVAACWRRGVRAERASRAACGRAPPYPAPCPRALSAEPSSGSLTLGRGRICGPARLAGLVGYRPLDDLDGARRHGCSQRRAPRPGRRHPALRVRRSPGRCCTSTRCSCRSSTGPGTGRHGERRRARRPAAPARVYVARVIDDHSRLAYCELHGAETAGARHRRPCAARRPGSTERAAARSRRSCRQRIKAYTGHAFRRCSPSSATGTSSPRPTPPGWNGKVERFFRALEGEWATTALWRLQRPTATAPGILPALLDRRRRHTSLGDRRPICRVRGALRRGRLAALGALTLRHRRRDLVGAQAPLQAARELRQRAPDRGAEPHAPAARRRSPSGRARSRARPRRRPAPACASPT